MLILVPRILDWLYFNYNNEYSNLVECGFDSNSNINANNRIIYNIQLILIFELELWITFISITTLTINLFIIFILFYFSLIEILITGK